MPKNKIVSHKKCCALFNIKSQIWHSLDEESRTNSEIRWEIGGWRLVKQWRWREVYSLAFSPDGSWYKARWFSCLKSSRAPGVNPGPNVDNKMVYCPSILISFHLVFLGHLENSFKVFLIKRQNIQHIRSQGKLACYLKHLTEKVNYNMLDYLKSPPNNPT